MKIIADENIPFLHTFFAEFGDIVALSGRTINADTIKNADVLLIRSVTPVNETLLKNSSLKFIGSATAGTDHVDSNVLEKTGIYFSSAPEANAFAVVDYVLSAIICFQIKTQCRLQDLCVGIIGCGAVGSRLKKTLEYFHVPTLCCDPILEEQGAQGFVDLDALIARANILSLHTPLTRGGKHQTLHLFNHERLQKLQQNSLLINAARGGIVDEMALHDVLNKRSDLSVVLDVWEHEPHIDIHLIPKILFGTPHIAGYSLDGKARGTEMLYHAFCQFFNFPIRKKINDFLAPPSFNIDSTKPVDLAEILKIYDLRMDAKNLREILKLAKPEQGVYFDKLRRDYPARREFSAHLNFL